MAETQKEQYIRLRTTGMSKEEALAAVQRQPLSSKISGGLNAIFGGGTIGEAIGTGLAKSGLTGLSKGERQFVSDAPPLKEIAADTASVGLSLFPATKAGSAFFSGGKFINRATKGAALGAGIGAAEAVENNQGIGKTALGGAVVGGALPVAEDTIKLAGRLFGAVTKNAAGVVTGKGNDVIETVLRNPQKAQPGFAKDTTATLRKLSEAVRKEVVDITKEANKAYGQALKNLPDKPLPLKQGDESLHGFLRNKLQQFDVKVTANKFDFTESPFRSSEEKILRDVLDVVEKWQDTTPAGLNRLAIKVGNFQRPGDQSKALNSVIRSTKKNIRDYVGTKVPAVRELNRQYAESQDFLDALKQTLTKKDLQTGEKGVMLTAQRIGTLFNSNKELARELVEALERKRGINILAVEAGRQLQQAPSRASTSIGDLPRNILQTIIPPSVIGKIARITGLSQQKIKPVFDGLSAIEPASRAVLIRLLSDPSLDSQEDTQ